LSTHYKKQINFSDEALEAAEKGISNLLELATKADHSEELDKSLVAKFNDAMDDDLNTAKALALLFENKNSKKTLAYLLEVLGFTLNLTNTKDNSRSKEALNEVMDLILDIRKDARTNKDFGTSDKIRDSLIKAGIEIKDYRDQESEWGLS